MGRISARGTLPITVFEENLNGPLYVDIFRRKFPIMHNMYPEGYYFQQDNDPKHTSNLALDLIRKEAASQISWPPYSPDVSPIENIWAWLKTEVSKDQPKNIEALQRSI